MSCIKQSTVMYPLKPMLPPLALLMLLVLVARNTFLINTSYSNILSNSIYTSSAMATKAKLEDITYIPYQQQDLHDPSVEIQQQHISEAQSATTTHYLSHECCGNFDHQLEEFYSYCCGSYCKCGKLRLQDYPQQQRSRTTTAARKKKSVPRRKREHSFISYDDDDVQ